MVAKTEVYIDLFRKKFNGEKRETTEKGFDNLVARFERLGLDIEALFWLKGNGLIQVYPDPTTKSVE